MNGKKRSMSSITPKSAQDSKFPANFVNRPSRGIRDQWACGTFRRSCSTSAGLPEPHSLRQEPPARRHPRSSAACSANAARGYSRSTSFIYSGSVSYSKCPSWRQAVSPAPQSGLSPKRVSGVYLVAYGCRDLRKLEEEMAPPRHSPGRTKDTGHPEIVLQRQDTTRTDELVVPQDRARH
jgi:hypothetical protein